MGVGVNPPKTPLTKGSNGIATATLPNMCKMPGPPAPFVPAPLPNIGKSGEKPKGYSKKVKVEKKAVAIKGASFGSMGDMASKGTGGGMVSANTHGPCKFISPGSMDVKFEGKNVHLLADLMTNNGGGSGSPANSATMKGAINGTAYGGEAKCSICGKPDGHPIPRTKRSAYHAENQAKKAPPNMKKKKRKGYMVASLVCKDASNRLVIISGASSGGVRAGFTPKFSGQCKTAGGRPITPGDHTVDGSNEGGACAAAQVILKANAMGLKIESMTEVWSGPPNSNFKTGQHTDSCDTCKELLPLLLCDKP